MKGRPFGFARQIAHVLGTDLRRHWKLVVAVTAVLLAYTGGILPTADDLGRRNLPRLPVGFVPLLLAGAAALVVQADGPARDRLLRHTVPLHAGSVTIARVLLVGACFWALPVGVQAIWFHRLGAESALLALTLDSAVYLASILALAMAAGALTRTPRGLITLCLAVWGGLSLLRAIPGLGFAQTSGRLEIVLGWMLVGATVFMVQSITRHNRVVASVGLIALLGVPLLAGMRDRDTVPAGSVPEAGAPRIDAPSGIEIRLFEMQAGPLYTLPQRPPTEGVTAQVQLRLPPGVTAALTAHRAQLVTDAGDTLTVNGNRVRSRPGIPLGYGGALWPAAVAGLTPAGSLGTRGFAGGPGDLTVAEIPATSLETLGPGRVTMQMTFQSVGWRIAGRLPVTVGATMRDGNGTTFRVRQLLRAQGQLTAWIGERWQTGGLHFTGDLPGPGESHYVFVLANPRYGTYIPRSGGSTTAEQSMLVGGSWMGETIPILEFLGSIAVGRDGSGRLPDDWFDETEILVLEPIDGDLFDVEASWEIDQWPTPGRPVRYRGGGREGEVRTIGGGAPN